MVNLDRVRAALGSLFAQGGLACKHHSQNYGDREAHAAHWRYQGTFQVPEQTAL